MSNETTPPREQRSSLYGLVRLGIKSAIADAYWKLSWSKLVTNRMQSHSTIHHNKIQREKVNFFADYVGRSDWNGMNCEINGVPHTITVQKSNT